MVKAIRVTFACFPTETNDLRRGPVFTVYFHDLFGRKSPYVTDYRLIGARTPTPSAQEISEHFCECLPRFIRGHVELGKKELARQQQILLRATGDSCIW